MTIWQQINQSLGDVTAQVARSVVQIIGEEGSIGAGTIWSSDGFILTNAHVALGRRNPRTLSVIMHDNRQLPAKLVAYDKTADLAVLEVDTNDLPSIAIGDSSCLQAGQYLMALGHPWGMIDALTGGVVIGIGDQLPESDGRDWIALDMKMRPGHSGGALFNSDGQLVGINTMIRGPEVSFAVPVNTATQFLKEVFAQYQKTPQAEPINPTETTMV